MEKKLARLKNFIFPPEMTLEQRIFNLLCLTGFLAALPASFIRGLWLSADILTFLYLLIVAALLGFGVLALRRYDVRRGVIVPILAVSLNVLFPLIYFTSGGIHSGMTAYFVLSLALFFVFLQGRICLIMVLWNIAAVLTCYVLGWIYPDLVTPLRAPYMVSVDSVLAILLSGLLSCLLIKAQTDAYIEEKRTAQMATKARSDFLANISHEIRTPLNAIIGVSELELRGAKNPEARESLQKMHDSGLALLNIINDILDISKMEAGHFELLPARYDPAGLVRDVINQPLGQGGKNAVEFQVRVSPKLPRVLFGDEAGLRQIIVNLLSNAFKYTDQGGVVLEISPENGAETGEIRLRIAVRDTGRGIRPEDMDRLFSDYGKLDLQATALEGIGLGLTICKKLAEMMGGGITVQSEFGRGSLFTARIPQKIVDPRPIGLATAESLNLAPARRAEGQAAGPAFRGRVLVVDDTGINLEIAKSLLQDYGLEVDTALGGGQALEALRAEGPPYDLIFMDHVMPGMSGAETVRAIRALRGPRTRGVPIIGLTARDRGDPGNDSFFKDIQDLVPKPIDAERLEKVLRRWLKK